MSTKRVERVQNGSSVDCHLRGTAAVAHRPRILIVSGVRLCREGIALALGRTEAVDVLGAAAPFEAFACVAALAPDAVVLDSSLDDGLVLARRLREVASDAKIVAFAVSPIDRDVIAHAEAGMSAFVPRDGSIDDLLGAIQQAMRGEFACSPRLTALLLARIAALSTGQPAHEHALTQREKEIVLLVEQGLSNKEIARRLSVGTATVKNHVHNILEKLQVRRRGQAAARMRRNLIP